MLGAIARAVSAILRKMISQEQIKNEDSDACDIYANCVERRRIDGQEDVFGNKTGVGVPAAMAAVD